MLVGVISDTHDHIGNIITALELFKEKNVELVVHCGDIVAPFCLDYFNSSGIDWIGVFGNNDGEIEILLKKSNNRLTKAPREENIGGRRVLVVHYHYFVDKLAGTGYYDLILYGHTHKPEISNVGGTLIVNPGEACGLLTGKATVAIVNLESMKAEILEI